MGVKKGTSRNWVNSFYAKWDCEEEHLKEEGDKDKNLLSVRQEIKSPDVIK